jgi:hypothetical protein
MKLNLDHFSTLAVKAQKYLSLAMMAYTILMVIIRMCPPDSGGGTGL